MPEVAACPVEDCRLAVDVVLISSDEEPFGAHQHNLGIYTEGFPIAGSTVASDPVSLEETAEVLQLILKFTHNIRPPSLDTTSFTLLASLAEGVEKYKMYSAMEICRMQMMRALGNHPNEIFFYSVKHNYPDLADQAAKLTLKNPACDFVDLIRKAGFHDGIIVQWLLYRDRWIEVLVQFPDIQDPNHWGHYGGSQSCLAWRPFVDKVFKEVSCDLSALDRFFEIVGKLKPNCGVCSSHGNEWASRVTAKIAKLPKYSEVYFAG